MNKSHLNAVKLPFFSCAEIIPYSQNARTHSAAQISAISASIAQFGFTNPVLIDETNVLIAGHGRLLAAQQLGMAEIPAIVLQGLSEAQKQALRIADNKLALNAGWDDDLLRGELMDLRDVGFDLALTGFGEDELAGIFADRSEGLTDPDDVPEPPAEPVSRPGDVWLLGRHRLVCGDATSEVDVALCLAGVRPHLMVTDPPYGVGYDAMWRGRAGHATLGKNRTGVVFNDDNADWRDAWRLFPGSIAYVWHGALTARLVAESLEDCEFAIRSQIIWNKTTMTMGRGDYHWKHEPCWYAVRGVGNWTGDRKQTTVWDIASPIHIMSGSTEEKTAHPTQKPAECMRRPIENNSSPGQAVYDPFLGSSTTIIAAEMTGRVALGLEISPNYVDIGVIRWQNFTGQQATRERDGVRFDDVETAARQQSDAA